ncbi:MAG TPA: peptidoglycan DD-metalloendopeptidase family protein [Candidatus Sumerlaeota bacterium]|nr:peptidoglycan DD-metalloendopeptidase family protein [Candidatus Sumerlaeota bacterium]HPK02964.1 peptidoglycan DD-metalloendopeptidase family protein [Candidatus Sumerlaeota bacterium]
MQQRCRKWLAGPGSLVLCAALLLAAGCARAPRTITKVTPAPPERVVLDYRNGWLHPADGRERIGEIARRYDREPALVALLNRAAEDTVPAAATSIYIPPTNNRESLRGVLARIQNHPELVPDRPWAPPQETVKVAQAQTKRVIPSKSATADLKQRLHEAPLLRNPPQPEPEVKVAAASAAALPVLEDAFPPAPKKPAAHKTAVAQAAPILSKASVEGGNPVPKPAKKRAGVLTGFKTGPVAIEASQPAKSAAKPAVAPQPEVGGDAPSAAGFIWPAKGRIVSRFQEGWRKACHGIEIATAENAAVRAARDGKVLLAQQFMSYGNLIVIDHGDGYASAYGYNDKVLVKEGDQVKRGQQIASAGRRYRSGEPMLFFQIRHNMKPVDPLTYLN